MVTRVTLAPRRRGLLGHRVALLARRAVADEAHRVDRLPGAAGRDDDAEPGEVVIVLGRRAGRRPHRRSSRGRPAGPCRCRRPPGARSPGSTTWTPRPRSTRRLSCTAGCSHISVCMAGHTSTGARVASRTLVSRSSLMPAGVEAQDLGGRGRDEHEVSRLTEVGVRDRMGFVPQGRPCSLRGEGVEGRSPDEVEGAVGEDRDHVRARVHEPTADLYRLVGGDAPGHAEDDALALEHGAWVESTYSADSEPSPSASSPSTSGSGQ